MHFRESKKTSKSCRICLKPVGVEGKAWRGREPPHPDQKSALTYRVIRLVDIARSTLPAETAPSAPGLGTGFEFGLDVRWAWLWLGKILSFGAATVLSVEGLHFLYSGTLQGF